MKFHLNSISHIFLMFMKSDRSGFIVFDLKYVAVTDVRIS